MTTPEPQLYIHAWYVRRGGACVYGNGTSIALSKEEAVDEGYAKLKEDFPPADGWTCHDCVVSLFVPNYTDYIVTVLIERKPE